jgi:hypothetical protein
VGNSTEIPQKIMKSYHLTNLTTGIYLKELKSVFGRDTCSLVGIAALCPVAKK